MLKRFGVKSIPTLINMVEWKGVEKVVTDSHLYTESEIFKKILKSTDDFKRFGVKNTLALLNMVELK